MTQPQEDTPSSPSSSFAGALKFDVDQQNGRFAYQVPIAVPPARQGAQPKLQLGYGSTAGNGWCGMGWTMDIGQIERETRNGPPIKWVGTSPQSEYDDAKGFVFGMAGASGRLVATPTAGEYRLEIQTTYLVFQRDTVNNKWVVTDAAGNQFHFGQTADSRMVNTRWSGTGTGFAQTFRWMLDKIVDINGNETLITWQREQELLYPQRIEYNGNINQPALGHPAKVEFTLEDRPDKTVTYRGGYRVEQNRRLKTIETFVNTSRVARYEIGYRTSPSTVRSLLETVTLYGTDNTTHLEPLRFTYREPSLNVGPLTQWQRTSSQPTMYYLNDDPSDVLQGKGHYALLDLDGDGLPDRVWRDKNTTSGEYSWKIERNNGTGFSAATTFSAVDNTGLGVSGDEADAYAGFGATHTATDGSRTVRYEQVLDVNGDGRLDRLVCNQAHTAQYVQLNTGSGLGPLTLWWNSSPNLGELQITEKSAPDTLTKCTLLDLNADGKPDRVYLDTSITPAQWKVQFNTGSGWQTPVLWAGVAENYIAKQGKPYSSSYEWYDQCSLADLNGDGLPDRIQREGDQWRVQYNMGDRFASPSDGVNSFLLSPRFVGQPPGLYVDWAQQGFYHTQTLYDWNGDGLPDRRAGGSAASGGTSLFINTGREFAAQPWTVTGLILGYKEVLDENGEVSGYAPRTETGYERFQRGGVQGDAVDINGDGLLDRVAYCYSSTFWQIDPNGIDDPVYRGIHVEAQLNQGGLPDLMIKVTSPLGGSVDVTYVPSTTFPNVNESGVPQLPFPVQVVKTAEVNDGFGNKAKTTYNYSGGFFDGVQREFRGFHRVEAVDDYGLKTVMYYHQGGGYNDATQGEYQDHYAKKGMPYKVEAYDKNGVIVSRMLNKTAVAEPITGVYFPHLAQTIKLDYADATHYRATAQQTTFDATTGNVTDSVNLGEVTAVNLTDHTFTDSVTTDNVQVHTIYKTFVNTSIKSKPEQITTSRVGTTEKREAMFAYDTRGNLTEKKVWLDRDNDGVNDQGTEWVSGGLTEYDTLGNPWRSTDAAGVVTEITYDTTYKTFPVTTTVAPGTAYAMASQTQFDARSGQATRTTSHLGVIARTDYDVLFRPTESFINETAFAEPTLWRTRTVYNLNGISGTTCNNQIIHSVYDPNDTANGIQTYSYLDGLGRAIQTRVESEISGQFRCSDVYPDAAETTKFSPYPYMAAGSGYAARTTAQMGDYAEFDDAGRAWKATPAAQATYDANRKRQGTVTLTGGDTGAPVDATTTVYKEVNDPWVTIATDAEGKVSKAYLDAFGRTATIVNVTAQHGNVTTTYGYDPLTGDLVRVTDNANNQTVMAYDTLGRKTSMTDPDMGTWTYQYDDAGRLTDQYDAKNQRIHFVFEPAGQLGRLVNKEIYDSASTLKRRVTWQYDTPVKSGISVARGQLAAVTETAISCNIKDNERYWSYDYKGRVLKEGVYSWAFKEFVTSYTYNQADQVDELSYPNDVARLKHTYQNGLLKKVQSSKGTGATSETFYELTALNDYGQPTEYKTHNGQVVNTYSYYANSKRLQTLAVTKSGNTLLSKTYAFDKVSNVKSITDNVASHTGLSSGSISSIQYDDLHRLTGLTDASGSRSYQYSALGNLMVNGDWASGTYVYGSSRPHAVTSANGKSYGYDANGSMINRNGQTLVYDEENRLIQVTDGASCNVHFGYSYDGARLWKFNKTENKYTCFVSGLYEYRENDGAGLCYVYAGGKRIAAFRPTADVYNLAGTPLSFPDHLMAWVGLVGKQADAALRWAFEGSRTLATVSVTSVVFACLAWLGALCWLRVSVRVREARFYWQPLWRRALAFALIPVLLVVCTDARAQSSPPAQVFFYYHGDHLGSSNLTTDRAGNVLHHFEYKAYGAQRYAAPGNSTYLLTHRYTGQALDEDTGLYYYNARYYDSELGRFTQADTVVPSPGDAQTFNRYSYCGNNPLKYVDPSGHFLIPIIIGAVIGGAMAAATGGNIGMGILTGAIGGLFGGLGTVAGEAIGGTAGAFAGAVMGGAAGGAVSAAIVGGDIGMGALTGAIGGAIGWGVGRLGGPIAKWGGVSSEIDTLSEHLAMGGLSATGSAIGGGVGAEIQGGDFWEGAKYGAIGGAIGYGAIPVMKGISELVQGLMWNASTSKPLLRVSYTDGTSERIIGEPGDSFESFLDDVIKSKRQISDFEFSGHGTSKSLQWPGDNSVTWDPKFRQLSNEGGRSLNSKIRAAFSSSANIRLRACNSDSWFTRSSIAMGFATVLPGATVKGSGWYLLSLHGYFNSMPGYGLTLPTTIVR